MVGGLHLGDQHIDLLIKPCLLVCFIHIEMNLLKHMKAEGVRGKIG